MKFMILVAESEEDFAKRKPDDAGAFEAYMKSWMEFSGAMQEAGVLVSGKALQGPESATTVSIRDGKRVVQDGPFADAKEQLGGYFVIETESLDAARDWAAKSPTTKSGYTVVRQVLPFDQESAS